MHNSPDWLGLPVEIWLHILAFRSSLPELCRTCSQLLSLARPIMYSHLVVQAERLLRPNEFVADTFALLGENAELAASVRKLTLNAFSRREGYFINPGIIDIPSLWNMTRLKSVTIIGDISRQATRNQIAQFVQILHGLQLDELRFVAPGSRAFLLGLQPEQLTLLANAKVIECYMGVDYNDLLAQRLLILLPAATTTLTSLSLTAQYLCKGEWALHPLFNLHFPSLRALSLQSTADSQIACPLKFAAFLSAHHMTLEDLHLGYTPNSDTRAFAPSGLLFATELMNPDFLPKLRRFRGHCRNVEMMALARMKCLGTLEELCIGSGKNDPHTTIEDLTRMFDALDVLGPLSSLKHLDFDLFWWKEPEDAFVASFVRRVAGICGPGLEVWYGLLPYLGQWPIGLFEGFTRLRVIRLAVNSSALAGDAPADRRVARVEQEVVVRELAGICPVLEEVRIGRRNVCWKVDRHRSLGVTVRLVD
ncbi:hypothetical protein FB45DRAFT_948083 [Roridomyces roridus]|uniref:F-box domain-containing protein n=1 Tax=Roridomyces roridus TaxID=1738132 RepID=A0AAD7F9M0_9AGAR|nr:hypothetical protein FB45DRAFT_948083 [Roridomyces roridus]